MQRIVTDEQRCAGPKSARPKGLAAGCAPLGEVWEWLQTLLHRPWLHRVSIAQDLFCYGIVDRATLGELELAELGAWALTRGWEVSLQGRKVYLVPQPLTKAAAAREVVRRVGGSRLLAAGDSLLDRPLLLTADAAVRPSHGELAESGWSAEHVTVLPGVGADASAQVTEWFSAQTHPAPVGTPSPCRESSGT